MNIKSLNSIGINTWIGLIMVAAFILFANKLFGKTAEEKKAAEDALKKDASESDKIKELKDKGVKPSYHEGLYIDLADQLFKAMDGIGTNNAAVYSVFKKVKNDVDFVMLLRAFGTRKGENLQSWVHGDLKPEIISELNQIMAKKGVTYKI